MRLAFFGGSFDPPHFGHLAIARAAANAFSLDCVLLAPTGQQPYKRMGAEASFLDRLAMVRLLSAADQRLAPSALDAPGGNGAPNYTVDALTRLQREHPGETLFAILGADNLADLHGWRDFKRLFELAIWIAVSRPQYMPLDALSDDLKRQQERGRLHLIRNVEVPISSTDLRRRLHEGIDPSPEEIPEDVLHYIHVHRLYAGDRQSATRFNP